MQVLEDECVVLTGNGEAGEGEKTGSRSSLLAVHLLLFFSPVVRHCYRLLTGYLFGLF